MSTAAAQQTFALAFQHHQAGRLKDAEACYRQLLAVEPRHAEALHYLGVIAHQVGRHALAVDLIGQALALNPQNPSAYSNLGAALIQENRLNDAVAAYRRAIQLRPDYPEAHLNLGIALHDRNQFEEAIASFRCALELRPAYLEARLHLGAALTQLGRFEEAATVYRQMLQIHPDQAEIHNELGLVLAEQGSFDEAIAAFHRALQLQPGRAETCNNLGVTLAKQGRMDEAVTAYRRALQLRPDNPVAHSNLGVALAGRGQFDEALSLYRRALEIKPDYAEGHNNLGDALSDLGQLDEAMAAFHRALQARPDYGEAHINLGNAFTKLGRPDEALAAFHRALEIQPGRAENDNNLGNALKDQGRLDEAMAAYRRALERKPDYVDAHSNLVLATLYHPALDRRAQREERERWEQQHAQPRRGFIQPHRNLPDPFRRLKIGYVSRYFADEVVGRNLTPLFRSHDPEKFEILCYAGVVKPDWLTEEFRQRAHQWRSTVGVRDDALAEMIRQDGVDILVDLTLHAGGNRLPLFARQPAPVQVSFAGYPESTGLRAIGYRISDRYLESESGFPSNHEAPTSDLRLEEVCLIDSFWCYDPCNLEVAVNPLPAAERGHVTFGCLNNFCKVNEMVLRLWARVMRGVKDSRVVLLAGVGSHRDRTCAVLEREGVPAHRVEFVELRPRQAYLELYQGLDIGLDPFPYNGHSTSLDALWMGVPVVSLAGAGPVSRGGFSQLSNLGLPELIASSEDGYVAIAGQLAHDLPRLADLRATLRSRMEASPLMDAPLFARGIEAAYRSMWQRWCAEQKS